MNHQYQCNLSALYNLGQTCYLNAVIQCLAYTQPLAKFILQGDYHSEANLLLMEYAKLVKTMYSDQNRIKPVQFYKALLRSFKTPPHQQEDAHEVLLHILDAFHENMKRPLTIYRDFHSNENILIQKSLNYIKNVPVSPINQIFMGQLHQRTQCTKCRHLNHSFPTFMNLQLPLASDTLLKNNMNAKRYIKITDLIADYCHKEKITFTCEHCKSKNVEGHKKITIWRLPEILILTIGRFNPDYTKNDQHVDFDLEDLDLTKFLTYPVVSKQYYDLYATVNHEGGSLDYGHYISQIKYRNNWLKIDDEAVSRINPDDVINNTAYILFYRRNPYF
jgi:ubiquitin C-terminal hydrolase